MGLNVGIAYTIRAAGDARSTISQPALQGSFGFRVLLAEETVEPSNLNEHSLAKVTR